MGAAMTSVKFYLVGKASFTRMGYLAHRASFPQYANANDIITQIPAEKSLAGKNYLVTGANSGIGKEVAQFLYNGGATVHLVCRRQDAAEKAKEDIMRSMPSTESEGSRLPVYIADCGLEKDMRRLRSEFSAKTLDGLICNAGALLDTRSVTSENYEVTFATHLLFGSYLLGTLFMPLLESTKDSRLVLVSSGGMLNTKYPANLVDISTGTSDNKINNYSGQLAYAYAKRGQVLLAEQWAKSNPSVKTVSCHPGWCGTTGVDKAYGDSKKWLEPLRSPWEGAEGIAWLCAAPSSDIESGAFYLDRQPSDKHVSVIFGSDTTNTDEEVQSMMDSLKKAAHCAEE